MFIIPQVKFFTSEKAPPAKGGAGKAETKHTNPKLLITNY